MQSLEPLLVYEFVVFGNTYSFIHFFCNKFSPSTCLREESTINEFPPREESAINEFPLSTTYLFSAIPVCPESLIDNARSLQSKSQSEWSMIRQWALARNGAPRIFCISPTHYFMRAPHPTPPRSPPRGSPHPPPGLKAFLKTFH